MGIATMVKTVLTGTVLAAALWNGAHAADYGGPTAGIYGADEGGYAAEEGRRPQAWDREPSPHRRWNGGEAWHEGRGWWRRAGGRPWWRHAGDECRVIVKRHVDPWGEVRVKRIEICE